MKKKRIVFIMPALTHPRHHKRINALKDKYDIKVYAFDRGVYKKNTIENIDITVIGKMENKKYLNRIIGLKKVLSIIRKENNNETLFYFFSFDIALVGFFFLKKGKYIYEIGDFAYLGLNKSLRNLITKWDYRIMKKSLVTIFTSNGFIEYLRKENYNLSKEKFLVIPNKLPREITQFSRIKESFKDIKSLRFGFVGILRYRNTVLRFIQIIGEKYPTHSFVYYGDGGLKDEFLKLCTMFPNLKYGGAFKNPDDLGKIYNDFDIHLGCYDVQGINQRIAEPNKLYESIYFGNPLIATTGSFFGQRVKELNAGFEINASTDQNIINFIDSLNLNQLNSIRNSMLEIPTEELIISHKDLIDKIG